MANDYFKFKQFTVRQDRCAMKVGTDGTLLGSWANGGESVLDVGTGTGLIALMMAQRFPCAKITAIDISNDAFLQAEENVLASPYSDRISVLNVAFQQLPHSIYASIVCNPPFFENSLLCPDPERSMARHAQALPFSDLLGGVRNMLSDNGEFSVIIPSDYKKRLDEEVYLAGLFPARICAVKTTPRKHPRRYLLSYTKQKQMVEQSVVCLQDEYGKRTQWYEALTKDFYIKGVCLI